MTTLSVPLEYTSLSEDFILTKSPPESIDIRVSGSGFELLGEQMFLNRKKTLVDLSLARPTKTANRYFILTSILKNELLRNIDTDIELLNIIDDSLFLNTEKRLSKKISISANVELKFKDGYKQRGEIVINPSEVTLSGPQKYIDSVHTLFTAAITPKKLKDSLRTTVALLIPEDIKGVAVKPKNVEVLIPVEKYTEKVLKLAVKREVDDGNTHQLQTFPDEVEVTILVPLSKYNSLNESTLTAVVVYTKAQAERKKLSVRILNIPKYALLSKVEPERVEYILKK